jgi:hypothetical protein
MYEHVPPSGIKYIEPDRHLVVYSFRITGVSVRMRSFAFLVRQVRHFKVVDMALQDLFKDLFR